MGHLGISWQNDHKLFTISRGNACFSLLFHLYVFPKNLYELKLYLPNVIFSLIEGEKHLRFNRNQLNKTRQRSNLYLKICYLLGKRNQYSFSSTSSTQYVVKKKIRGGYLTWFSTYALFVYGGKYITSYQYASSIDIHWLGIVLEMIKHL